MNFRILRKDLKRKKSINIILLIFIILATTFIAGSINSMHVILGGMDYFMNKAEVTDYIIISSMGGSYDAPLENDSNIEAFLKENTHVTGYTVDDVLYSSDNKFFTEDGGTLALNASVMINSYDISQQKFFDHKDKEITYVEDGSIYLKRNAVIKNNLKPGDIITIKTESGYEKEFRLKGYYKDAFLGSDMMGMYRCIVSKHDFQELLYESGLPYSRMYSINSDNLKTFEADYNNCDLNVIGDFDKALIKTTYIMDMIIAGMFLMVSLCLIAISIVILRFTIIFTVSEDYKEIGIMKAIGIGEKSIRKIYLTKYFAIAVLGASIGFGGSILLQNLLIYSASQNMVLETAGNTVLLNLIVSMLVCAGIVGFAYLSTGKIKKFTPMDAIRNGNNGERFKKKGMFKLGKTHMKATSFLALNDVLGEMRKYMALLFASIVGIWLIVMPVNTINTLRSENIASWFALTDCDYYISSDEKISELITKGSKQSYYDFLEETKKLLMDNGIEVERTSMEVMFNLKIRKADRTYKSMAFCGLNTGMDEYFYDEGTPPKYDNEIAVTHIVADKIDAGIGDTVYISMHGEEKPYVITALYQSMNNMGQGIRLTENAELDYTVVSGGFGLQIKLAGDAAGGEIAEAMRKTKEIIPDVKVETVEKYIDSMIGGISASIVPVNIAVVTVVLIVNIMIVVLMQKMFLIREQGEMGMMKSLGFSNADIIKWQTKRIILVLSVGILTGTLTGTWFSQLTSGQIFKYMGAFEIEFEIHALEVYLIYPVILFTATLIGCILTMLKVRRISVQEINEME